MTLILVLWFYFFFLLLLKCVCLKSLQINGLKQIKLNSLEILKTSGGAIYWVIRPRGVIDRFPEGRGHVAGYPVISSHQLACSEHTDSQTDSYVELPPNFPRPFVLYKYMSHKLFLFLKMPLLRLLTVYVQSPNISSLLKTLNKDFLQTLVTACPSLTNLWIQIRINYNLILKTCIHFVT